MISDVILVCIIDDITATIIDDITASIIDIMAHIINGIPGSFVAVVVIGMICHDTSGARVSDPSCVVSTLMTVSPPGPLCGGPLPEL